MPILEGLQGVDLTTVNTSYPVLATGVYNLRIEAARVEPSKKNAAVKMLVLDLVTDAQHPDVAGQPIAPGYKITHRITVSPTEKRTSDMIARDIASLQEAAFGHRIPADQFDTDLLIGRTITAKTSVEDANGDFPAQARVSRFLANATAA